MRGESMDRGILEELIRDQERLLGIITENLTKLRRLAGQNPDLYPSHMSSGTDRADELRRKMEAQRKEIWDKAERAKQRALAQAQQQMGSMPGNMPGGMMGGMGMLGGMMGGMGVPGRMPLGLGGKKPKTNKQEDDK